MDKNAKRIRKLHLEYRKEVMKWTNFFLDYHNKTKGKFGPTKFYLILADAVEEVKKELCPAQNAA